MRRTASTALIALAAALPIAGCASAVDEPGAVSVTVTAPAPAVAETAAPTPIPEPIPEVVADEFSQVMNGVLYQGTEVAPVRIGADLPGQPPAAEAGFVAAEGWEQYAQDSDKYVVSVFHAEGGWIWKVFGLSRHGSFRELANSGYSSGTYLPSMEGAAAGPFAVDGRTLDRAEYILHVN